MERVTRLMHVVAVEPLDGFQVRFTFDDGVQKVIDLDRFLHGPIFEPLRQDQAMFRAATVESGTIAWSNGADIDPNVLYYDLEPDWGDDELEIPPRHTQLNLSMADILQAIHALSLADKAMLLSILSDEIADAVEGLETQIEAQRPEPALAVREEDAGYTAESQTRAEGERDASHRE